MSDREDAFLRNNAKSPTNGRLNNITRQIFYHMYNLQFKCSSYVTTSIVSRGGGGGYILIGLSSTVISAEDLKFPILKLNLKTVYEL